MTVKLPDDCGIISERIFEASKKLIEYNYWDNIEEHELSAWINNFLSEEEKYFAAVLLNSLIYRNSSAIKTFGAQLFHIIIPNYLEEKGIYEIESIDSWLRLLNQSGSRGVLPFRFTTVEAIDNKPAKSGATIFRELKRHFFDSDLGVGCQSLSQMVKNPKINTLIIFDDVIGTGEQFETFVKKYNVNQLGYNILYCPLAAHKSGIERIQKSYPNIDIKPIEILTELHSLFSAKNKLLEIGNATQHIEFLSFFKTLCDNRQFKIDSDNYLGKGELALTYLFKDSTPNNNISAIWYGDENWTRLAKR
ncbi:hypothetical protein H5158_12890 [Pseudoalteromonas sp. SR45-6]|uniref:phosphoribosyltransferase-like protein n=1 Tax=Pseudoalteromonas sp. SR45-6 TaxID=2760927 RepID=UPI001600B5D6|nr:hypothetical protein [Pseudoalteromonas sp. SR45-6]MBB1342531.1 hypothetical protein [Pseudoalteromonas sp. SR45-6]